MADNDGINQPNPPHCLFVMGEVGVFYRFTSYVDDDNFPEQRETFIAPEPLHSLRNIRILDSINGIICFYGRHLHTNTMMAVMWNPAVGKCVGINVILREGYKYAVVGFGVCHGDPKLVKISVREDDDGIPTRWEVDVFSLSTGEWRNVNAPLILCKLLCANVCLEGVIYFRAFYDSLGNMENFFISFNLETEEFGRVPLPMGLVNTYDHLAAAKLDGSLGLLQYHDGFCDVWIKEEGADGTFIRIHTVEVAGVSLNGSSNGDVLGFRNNGEAVVVELREPYNPGVRSIIAVYEPFFGDIVELARNAVRRSFSVRPYITDTTTLTDQPDSIIY